MTAPDRARRRNLNFKALAPQGSFVPDGRSSASASAALAFGWRPIPRIASVREAGPESPSSTAARRMSCRGCSGEAAGLVVAAAGALDVPSMSGDIPRAGGRPPLSALRPSGDRRVK